MGYFRVLDPSGPQAKDRWEWGKFLAATIGSRIYCTRPQGWRMVHLLGTNPTKNNLPNLWRADSMGTRKSRRIIRVPTLYQLTKRHRANYSLTFERECGVRMPLWIPTLSLW